MDKATKKGLENLEKSVRAEQLAEAAAEADKENVKSVTRMRIAFTKIIPLCTDKAKNP